MSLVEVLDTRWFARRRRRWRWPWSRACTPFEVEEAVLAFLSPARLPAPGDRLVVLETGSDPRRERGEVERPPLSSPPSDHPCPRRAVARARRRPRPFLLPVHRRRRHHHVFREPTIPRNRLLFLLLLLQEGDESEDSFALRVESLTNSPPRYWFMWA